jgi:chloramphenicol 3-O phosphotransferase
MVGPDLSEENMGRSCVIVLNGVGSVGKSATAAALQAVAAPPFLHVSMDAFIDMLPARLLGHADGLWFERGEADGYPFVAVHSGPVLERALVGMRRAVAALADAGNDLIVDEVMFGREHLEYRALLSGHDLRFVGLFAPLDILEARERQRGDREPGLSRWQFDKVHRDIAYDLTIDTTHTTPTENAMLICDAFGLERA